MSLLKADKLIDELIEISDTKYGYLKVGRDTLNEDILFIEKYEKLKEILGVSKIDEIDFKQLPKMKNLKAIIEKISDLESVNKKNVLMAKATRAYKK
jgi:hypothetical protein